LKSSFGILDNQDMFFNSTIVFVAMGQQFTTGLQLHILFATLFKRYEDRLSQRPVTMA